MDTFFDYIHWIGNYTFDQVEPNDVDQLILATLCYIYFEKFYTESESLESIAKRVLEKEFSFDIYRVKNDVELLKAASESKRFGSLSIFNPVGITTDLKSNENIQFGAMTFYDENRAFICFRGTDSTLVGWKEDFDMSFKDSVPADDKGYEYLIEVAKHFKKERLYITGHSKGGHIALYAYLKAKDIKKRVVACFNNDGPGFNHSCQEELSDEKIHTIIPETSIIGMLLCHSEKYSVVKSSAHLIMQHDPYSWGLNGPDFEYTQRSKTSVYFDSIAHSWLEGITPERRERFVETLFAILSSADTDSFHGFTSSVIKNLPKITSSITELDEEDKQMLMTLLKDFGTVMFKELKDNPTL